jgi:hypothetical protein
MSVDPVWDLERRARLRHNHLRNSTVR